MSEISQEKKIAVVLSGGGARGALQVGALKYLTKEQDKIQAYYGTSIGALNALGMATVGIDKLEELWLGVKKKSDILSFNWHTLGPLFGDGIYNSKPLRKKIDEYVKQGYRSKAVVCKVNLKTGTVEYGRNPDKKTRGAENRRTDDREFADSVQASAATPIFLSPINKTMTDGGIREMAPLAQAIRDGASRIIVILTAPWDRVPKDWKKPLLFPFSKLVLRVIDIIQHEITVNDIKLCTERNNNPKRKKIALRVYAPKTQVIDIMEFNPEKIRNAINAGYEMAKSGPVHTAEEWS